MKTGNRRADGASGEAAALVEYEKRGWTAVDRNWHYGRFGEIDIILARDGPRGRTLCFCEVKTRTGVKYGRPGEAVGCRKRNRIRFLAEGYLAEHPEYRDAFVRFDVCEVYREEKPVIARARSPDGEAGANGVNVTNVVNGANGANGVLYRAEIIENAF